MFKPQLLLLFLLLNISAFSQTWVYNPDWWICNGSVDVIEPDTANNVVYIAGNFDKIGPSVHNIAELDSIGFPKLNYDMPNGPVDASVAGPDSSWIFAGSFDKVGECSRLGLAQINENGKLTHLFEQIGFNKPINSLQIRDSIIYAAGNFSSVGRFKNYAAFFELNENQPDYNQPHPNGEVNSILDIPGGGWYVGGAFSMYGDSVRASLVSLDYSGNLTNWHPIINGGISTMLIVGDTLFIGGNFTEVNGQVRSNLAAFNRISGQLLSWSPTADSWVLTMSTYGNRIILGGYFNQINGNIRYGLASVNKITGVLDTWNPNPNYTIYSTVMDGTKLYVGGEFTQIAGQARNNIAVFDITTNSLTSWNPNANNAVWAIEVTNDRIYLGGEFDLISGQTRQRIVEFYKSTGTITSWAPTISTNVKSIKRNMNNLYVGGAFWYVNGQVHKHVALFDMTTGTLSNWSPNSDTHTNTGSVSINAISLQNGKIFIGGTTSFIGGTDQRYIVGINMNTGKLATNQIQINNSVTKIQIKDSLLYLAGWFTEISGITRTYVGEFNLNSNSLTAFNPIINSNVSTLSIQNDSLFIGGNFTMVNGQSRQSLAAFNTLTNTLLSWNPTTDVPVTALLVKGNRVLIGGVFSLINSVPVENFAILSTANGSIVSLSSTTVDGTVYTIESYGDSIFLGGGFDFVNTIERSSFAILDLNTETVLPYSPNPTSYIFTISTNGPKLFVGGQFLSIGAVKRKNIAAFDINTGIVSSWNPEVIGEIYSVKTYGNNVNIGGDFIGVNGTNQNYFAQLDRITGSLTALDLDPQGIVLDLEIQDSILYIGGNFNSIYGSIRNKIAAVNLNTSSLTFWGPTFDDVGYVNTIEVIENTVFLGGWLFLPDETVPKLFAVDINSAAIINSFTHVGSIDNMKKTGDSLYLLGGFTMFNGLFRKHMAAINVNSWSVLPFNPLTYNSANALHTANNTLYIGGSFNTYLQNEREAIVEVDLTNDFVTEFNPFRNATVDVLNSAENLLFVGADMYGLMFEDETYTNIAVFEDCNLPSNITLTASSFDICLGDSVDLSIQTGNLNDATQWVWYEEEVGCNPIGQGTVIAVSPSETTTYLLRGEGGCSRKQPGIKIKIIVDEETPIISNCPPNQTLTYNQANCSASATWIQPTAVDNCSSSLTVFESHQPGDIFPQGNNLVTYLFTDSSNNTASCEFTISVISALNATGVIANSTCFGSETGAINITPTGGVGTYMYSWNNGVFLSQDLSNLAAGIYTITLTDSDQCQFQEVFEITEPAPLNTNVVVTGDVIVSTNTSAGISYAWLDCNNGFTPITGENSQVFQASQDGSYAVSVIINGCINIGTCYSIVNVGVQEITFFNFSIYPNPSDGIFYFEGLDQTSEITILDMYGREIQKHHLDNQNKINLTNECDGLYFVFIEFEGVTEIRKIIKN